MEWHTIFWCVIVLVSTIVGVDVFGRIFLPVFFGRFREPEVAKAVVVKVDPAAVAAAETVLDPDPEKWAERNGLSPDNSANTSTDNTADTGKAET